MGLRQPDLGRCGIDPDDQAGSVLLQHLCEVAIAAPEVENPLAGEVGQMSKEARSIEVDAGGGGRAQALAVCQGETIVVGHAGLLCQGCVAVAGAAAIPEAVLVWRAVLSSPAGMLE
jgi:hypothetical protein